VNIGKKEALKMINSIGIIVEDTTDYEAAKILIQRVTGKNNLTFKKSVSNGCGKLRRKALDYTNDLTKRGCQMVIIIHDKDRNCHNELMNELCRIVKPTKAKIKHICIPIEEMEAWFISDPQGIKDSFNLKRLPRFKGNPETINSPKEVLAEQVYLCSNKSTIFLTKHNQKLAEVVSLDKAKDKCKSFSSLVDFLEQQTYK
jgi:hypothetical protein